MNEITLDETRTQDRIRTPNNPADPFETEFRATLAVLVILARRATQHLAEKALTVTSVSKDGAETVKPAPMLTTYLRLQREIRAQYRFLTDYLEDPLYTGDAETQVEHGSAPTGESAEATKPTVNPLAEPNLTGGSSSTSTGPKPEVQPAKRRSEPLFTVGSGHAPTAPDDNTADPKNKNANQPPPTKRKKRLMPL